MPDVVATDGSVRGQCVFCDDARGVEAISVDHDLLDHGVEADVCEDCWESIEEADDDEDECPICGQTSSKFINPAWVALDGERGLHLCKKHFTRLHEEVMRAAP